MAEVRPFRGWRYNTGLAGELGTLIAPPYDVISPEQQQRLLERNPNNVVRVELQPALPGDPSGPAGDTARHLRARGTLDQWEAEGILRQDPDPSLYLYEHRFTYAGEARTRRSLVCAVRLTPWSAGQVIPHEHTLTGPKAERLGLLRATSANTSPIWSLYEDRTGVTAEVLAPHWEGEPIEEAVDEDGGTHVLRAVQERAVVAGITEPFSARQLFIADGHHRYETALSYAEEDRRARGGAAAGSRALVMMMLTATDDPGLVVLPTHRVVHSLPQERLAALARLEEGFGVRDLDPPADVALLQRLLDDALLDEGGEPAGNRLILAGPEPGRLRLLEVRAEIRGAQPPHLSGLATWQAHATILDRLLGIDAASLARQEYLRYTRDAAEAFIAVRDGDGQLAIFLAHTPVRQLLTVARAGAVMPQKSTYFYPKPATGMVIRRMPQP